MKETFNVRDKKGSIALFVLVGLLFMSAFLIISYGYNVNKSKIAKEQFNSISDIYSYKDGDANAYERAYTALRNNNKRSSNKSVENKNALELKQTYGGKLENYKIYGRGTRVDGYKMTITNLTKAGFLPKSGGVETNTTYPNAKYEVIEIKQGQKFKFNFSATETSGNYGLRVRCIDAENNVVCDLVNDNGTEEDAGKDYFETTIYYAFAKRENGYVLAKKDFKIGIMYIHEYIPEDFKLEIETELPEGYEPLEYLESERNQYIKTGINATEKTVFEIDTVSKDDYSVFGARGTGTGALFNLTGNGTRSFRWGSERKDSTGYSCQERAVIIFGQQVFLDGNLIIEYNNSETFTTEEVYLFRRIDGDAGCCTIYYLKVYEDKQLIRYYVPCCRIADNGIGMYDLLENKFYENAGTGTFKYGEIDSKGLGDLVTETSDENYGKYKISIKISDNQENSLEKDIFLDSPLYEGEYIDYKLQKIVRNNGTEESIELPSIELFEDYTKIEVSTEEIPAKIEVNYEDYNINRLDSNYQQLEYIKSTGTQYIKTGINATEKTVLEIETVSENDYSVFGAAGSGNSMFNLTGNGTRSFRWGGQANNGTGYSCQERAVIKFGQQVFLDENLIIEYSESATFTTDEIYLFTRNNGGKPDDSGTCAIYYVKIKEAGKLIRDYVPCYRKSDNVIGLYDLVESKFYTNAGTGELVAGPEA